MTQQHDGFGLVVRFDLLDGHEEAFDALVAETVALIGSEEPGTLAYVVHREVDGPSVRVFYELYQDAAAFEAHESSPHGRRFLSERGAHLRSEPLVWRLSRMTSVMRSGPGG